MTTERHTGCAAPVGAIMRGAASAGAPGRMPLGWRAGCREQAACRAEARAGRGRGAGACRRGGTRPPRRQGAAKRSLSGYSREVRYLRVEPCGDNDRGKGHGCPAVRALTRRAEESVVQASRWLLSSSVFFAFVFRAVVRFSVGNFRAFFARRCRVFCALSVCTGCVFRAFFVVESAHWSWLSG